MCGRADGRDVSGKIEAVAFAGGINSRKTLFEKVFRLRCHVQVNVWRVGALHFADDGAGNDVARRKFLRFVVALHEAFEIDVAQDAAFAAQRFGKKKAWRAFYGER